jgi:DNA-binding LacI/PurR family transcriptional regulator
VPADARPAVTLEHVARAAGVSRATASRALTGGGPVSTETQRQVRAAAETLGYVADPVARALVSGRGRDCSSRW